jgi:hypothetical protein
MTVNYQVPYNAFTGNGSLTTFAYTFEALEDSDVKVLLDGVLQIEDSHYTYENVTENGGEIEFITAPAADASVVVYRDTPITQQVDYVDGVAFPAETHELGADKLIIILQELVEGFVADDGGALDLDLSVTFGETTVTIVNAAGSNAVIQPWDITEDLAGAFHGEITTSAPVDDAVTTKDDGYIWYEVLP